MIKKLGKVSVFSSEALDQIAGKINEISDALNKHLENTTVTIQIDDEKENVILVPENIKIYDYKSGYVLGFGDGQGLCMHEGTWAVGKCKSVLKDKVQCRLVHCKREDLKAGELAFRTEFIELSDKNILQSYCFILDDKKYAYIADGDSVGVGKIEWKYWYRVERV